MARSHCQDHLLDPVLGLLRLVKLDQQDHVRLAIRETRERQSQLLLHF